MAYLIGTDEAGYGPNLGPLVISATVWRVPDELAQADLYDLLAAAVSAGSSRGGPAQRVRIADSKALYKSGGTLARLEQGVLAALAASGSRPETWQELWDALDPDSLSQRGALPWYDGYDRRLPIDAEPEHVLDLSAALSRELARKRVQLVTVRSTAIFPHRFNGLIEQLGNKGVALSRMTLGLVDRVLAPLDKEPIYILCDKHGGRNKYGPLLQTCFPDHLVEVYQERRAESLYRWGPPERRVEIRFRVRAESCLPCALASMASKYLRQLAMQALNSFWRQRVTDLRPTAGYPLDAKRFKADISTAQRQLGIEDQVLWRSI